MKEPGPNESSESKWKQKYFDHLDKTDANEKRLRQRANVIAEGLVSLCDFSGHINDRLYKLCKPIRQTAQKDVFDSNLPQQISKLKNAFSGLEAEIFATRSQTVKALQNSTEQLIGIAPSSKNQRNLHKLKKSLSSDEVDETDLIEHVMHFNNQLQNLLIDLKPNANKKEDPSLLKKIFSKNKHEPEPDQEQQEQLEAKRQTAAPADYAQTNIDRSHEHSQNIEQIATILLYLLNQLDVPNALKSDAEEIETHLQQNPDWPELERLLMPIIELTLATIEWHYRQFGGFLEQINSQLDAVQNFLLATQQSRNNQKDNHNKLNETMCEVVNEIEDTINESEELEHLKQTISQKMQGIVVALAAYEEAEHERETQLVNELENLSGKLQEMESQSQEMRAKLESQKQLARHDSVTQLPNRAAYDERIQFEYARWQRYHNSFILLLADIDLFKKINDVHGHLAGDKVLRLVAKTLKDSLRETDFIARYGGEEFAIILPSTVGDVALHTAEKLRQAIANCPFHRSGEEVDVTVSIGISEPVSGDSIETIFDRADKALYKAKELGRNRCCVGAAQS